MMSKDTTPVFCPRSQKEWRQWLRKNHKTSQSVWLILYKKKANVPTINWSDAVDQALCFGWIDGKRLSLTEETFKQFFCKRKPASTWSRINKLKVEALIKKRQMTKAGYDAIARSKENGSWTILDDVEKLIIPPDLENAFKKHPGLKKKFLSLAPSKKKIFLMSLRLAKTDATRNKRIKEIVQSLQ